MTPVLGPFGDPRGHRKRPNPIPQVLRYSVNNEDLWYRFAHKLKYVLRYSVNNEEREVSGSIQKTIYEMKKKLTKKNCFLEMVVKLLGIHVNIDVLIFLTAPLVTAIFLNEENKNN
jgi:hypothetical protein